MESDRVASARHKIAKLSTGGLDLVTFWRESTQVLAKVVPHIFSPCWYTLDPASLLVTSHFQAEIEEIPEDWLVHEYMADDVNKLADVARSEDGISTLHEATNGDPSHTPRWQMNMQMGGDQELIAALRTRAGDVWGAMGLYRESGSPMFDEQDKSFIRQVSPLLAEGARRSLLVGEANDPEGPDAPGIVVISDRWEIESSTPGADRWMADLPDGDWGAGRLPTAVFAVAARAMRSGDQASEAGDVAIARVMTRSGEWLVLHGMNLVSTQGRRVAVIAERATGARITPLLMSAYGLTDREQDVTRLVLKGSSTTEIAAQLFVSPHTVQEHLKSVFEKTGVRSRRDLIGKVFFRHYEPRLRDNEERAMEHLPLRGGPKPAD